MASACALTLFAVACNTIPTGEVRLEGRGFLAMVPDSVDDVGLDPSITVSDDGVPYVSYFGFPAELTEGGIPVSRPVGAPYLTTEDGDDAGAVLLASLSPDTQVWNRGAVAQPRATPSGVTVPFGPAEDDGLASLTPENTDGTDVAVSGSDVHVVWAANEGVRYGIGPDFELETVEATPGAGAASIALDADGNPLVAYVVAGVQPRVTVAERVGERWRPTVVTTLSECGRDCPPPAETALVGDEPLVVVADPSTHELIGIRRDGSTWSSEVIATDVVGGASLAAADDTAVVAYYTSGGIAIATGRPGNWSTQEVASVTPSPSLAASPTATPSPTASPTSSPGASPSGSPSPSEGSPSPSPEPEPIRTEPTTGVAVDGEGTIWVTWEDVDGVHLASSTDDGELEEQELSQTEGGVTPSVAATEDGSSVYLAWLDPLEGDLRVGVSADLGELLLAAPSPTPPPPTGGVPAGECGEDGELVLSVVAQGQAFDPTCLVAPAGQPFTIDFDNQDPVSSTGPHNIAIGEDQATVTDNPIFKGDAVNGPDEITYDVPAIDEPGDYFFQCDFHPTTMTGTFAVVEAGGGGGGGGHGGGQGGGGGGQGGGGGGQGSGGGGG